MKLCLDLGLGFESASFGELSQALHVGTPPNVRINVINDQQRE